MNNRSLFRTLTIAAVIIAGGVLIGIEAYNAGVAHGIAVSGRAAAGGPAGGPYLYVWPRPWGFGFGFFPFFLLLFFFFAVRGLLWRGPWHRGWSYRHDEVPPAFDEWHRRAHAQDGRSQPPAAAR